MRRGHRGRGGIKRTGHARPSANRNKRKPSLNWTLHLPCRARLMTEEFQIQIPASFMALFVPPGRIKPLIGQREMAARYELCEDMAQLLTEQAAQHQFQLGITEDLALERCLQGLLATPEVLSQSEARWVICRLAELLQWPRPEKWP